MALASGLAPAAVSAAPSSGGVTYTPEPTVAAVSCVKNCASKQRIQGGSAVKISGKNLGSVTKVVFRGSGAKADDKAVPVKARASARSLVVAVPFDAQTGPVQAVASGGVASTDDIVALKAERVVGGAILGRSLYDGRVDPAAALALAAA